MNDTRQILTYANGVNLIKLISDDIRTTETNPDVLLDDRKYNCLAVNTEKTKYMEIGRHRIMMANDNITVGSNSMKK